MTWIYAPDNWAKVTPVFESAPFDDPIEFNDTGSANVKQDVADFLVEQYDGKIECETEEPK